MKTAFCFTALVALTAFTGCTVGSQILEVGKECTSDADCSDVTECAPADSPNATRVCMPIDDGGASG